jgi:hypothetical protein
MTMSDNETLDPRAALEAVRSKASQLGVKWHQAEKAETIQAKVDAFLATQGAAQPAQLKFVDPSKDPALALVPITITSMDPADAQIPCVTISVGNRRLGQITKVIPFNHKWYMPRILVEEIKSKRFIRNSMVPVPGGNERLKSDWIPKYGVIEHPMPTQAELDELARMQALGNELAK